MTNDRRFRGNDRALLTLMADGTGVLLHLDTKFYYTLNPVGVCVWKSIDAGDGATLAELTTRVCQEFDVDHERAHRDIDELLVELAAEELVLA